MFEKGVHTRAKFEALVSIITTHHEPFDGFVFLRRDERVADLLNDERAFIPVKLDDSTTIILAKSNIVSITEQFDPSLHTAEFDDAEHAGGKADEAEGEKAKASGAAADGREERGKSDDDEASDAGEGESDARERAARRQRAAIDPYEVLRVSRTAAMDEIRQAYKSRIKAVHPDTIASLGLDPDLEQAAMATAQKVNRAYQAILAERRRNDSTVKASLPGA